MSITRRLVIRLLAASAVALIGATALSQRALPDRLVPEADANTRAIVLDRSGAPLNVRYQQRWNTADRLPLAAVPMFFRQAMVTAEDRRYWQHSGIDWRARISAIEQSLRARRAVRGASTISEQVVRLLHPRPRTVWSRWVEGFEAMRLEARFSKSEILEFYLDQVPYGAHRRGVVQASRHYFGRDPATLSEPEMLALAVMPRAPSRLDPIRDPSQLAGPMQRVATRMAADGLIAADQVNRLATPPSALRADDDDVPAAAFIAEVLRRAPPSLQVHGAIRSSLDRPLQREAQRLLDQRVQELAPVGVRQGGLLVIDRIGNRVRAWNVANLDAAPGETGIDIVRTARQPGSALKPFVYALALESGWTAATPIEDDLLAAHVSDGIHPYRNYSRLSYGTVTVREALGNSLNVPAVKALQFVGGERFLSLLRQLGMNGLTAHPDWYGDGIALGNGEVSLLELTNAYSTLANDGRARPLTVFEGPLEAQPEVSVINREAASIVTDILSDPRARLLEFGSGGLLRFPAQTAVKTGTSSDYRDAWCVAFNHRYVVGAWMGALAGRPMDGVTGSIGPALLVRSVFAVLNRDIEPQPMSRSPLLVARMVPAADGGEYREWFAPSTEPSDSTELGSASGRAATEPPTTVNDVPQLLQPFDGLRMAIDPRVPPEQQALEFRLTASTGSQPVRWFVDDAPVSSSVEPRWLWRLQRGEHTAHAEAATGAWRTATVRFRVK